MRKSTRVNLQASKILASSISMRGTGKDRRGMGMTGVLGAAWLPRLFAPLALLLLLVTTTACTPEESIVAAALEHADRPSEDATDDAARKPQEVLEFAGLQAGMDVFEMEAGGGYYTEIIARAVGPEGSVVMQNPPSFDSFVGDAPATRSARLSNIRVSSTNFDALDASDGSMDMVTWILGPHELWFMPGGNVNLGDPETTFQEIARILKPGGVFLAVDHHAAADSGPEVGGTLHRIREDLIQELAEGAGLTVLRSSAMHENAEDPLNIGVFDESIRRATSRFVVLYSK
ncbi:MAG: methyltransferase domain-containing protein [Pseudohongiellaceae bacterium]